MNRDYLTDEELNSLIEDVENNSMLTAPNHLKSNIYSKIALKRKRAKATEILYYRFKVITISAAAILLFCILPGRAPSSLEKAAMQTKARNKRIESNIERTNDKIIRAEKLENFFNEIDIKFWEE